MPARAGRGPRGARLQRHHLDVLSPTNSDNTSPPPWPPSRRFWDAVQELKRVHAKDVAQRVEAIWTEYLAQDANCPINIDSKSYETSKKNMAKNKNNRYIFDEAAGHVYQLMKNDSYPRYLRSDMYKDYKEASERRRPNQVAFDVFKPQITTLKHKFNF